MSFEFDPTNFGAGFAAGLGTGYVIYRARGAISALRATVGEQATSAQEYATRSADKRYLNDLTKAAQQTHLAGHKIDLNKILVEPRFIRAAELIAMPDEDDVPSVFEIVPKIHDMPYLHAPYNVETLSIEDLGRGDRAIALLGNPGSGRTTALFAIAMWAIGAVDFKPPPDNVLLKLQEEEKALPAQERANRAKKRAQLEEQARERLAQERGESAEQTLSRRPDGTPMFRRLEPIYVHLANLHTTTGEYGRSVDPAEPLVRAIQQSVRSITAHTIPRQIYEKLQKGQLLLLLDGYDELPEKQRKDIIHWLDTFTDTYSRNFVIITGPTSGYGDFLATGYAPVYMRPWGDQQITSAVHKWAEHWADISGKRRASIPEDLIERVQLDSRSLTPLEVTLRIWSEFARQADDAEMPTYEAWIRDYLHRQIDNFDSLTETLAKMATLQLDEGYITRKRLVEIELDPGTLFNTPEAKIAAANFEDDEVDSIFGLPDDMDETEDDDDDIALLRAFEDEDDVEDAEDEADIFAVANLENVEIAEEDEIPETKEARKIASEQNRLLKALLKSGVLVRYRGNRYQFQHPIITAYLASLMLATLSEDAVMDKMDQPVWQQAVAYLSLHTPVDSLVAERLQAQHDVLYNNIAATARWLVYTGPQVTWRSQLLRELGNLLVAPTQYPLIRERVAAALVGTRDDGSLKIFRRSVRSANVDVRKLSALALGALRDTDAVRELTALLDDDETDVQLAAGMALGAIGTEDALQSLAEAFTSGTERLRQCIAETFAALPTEGYPLLHDAINHDEMMLRRAAVFGLRRVNTGWALRSIYQVYLEDQQWYVRSAAQQVFQELQTNERRIVRGYPQIEAIPWLLTWAKGLGERMPEDPDGESLLQMALSEDDYVTRLLATMTTGQLGLLKFIRNLYASLYDQQDIIRDAAYRALSDIQTQLGQPLPAPV